MIRLQWLNGDWRAIPNPIDFIESGAELFTIRRGDLVDPDLFNLKSSDYGWPAVPVEGWRETLRHSLLNAETFFHDPEDATRCALLMIELSGATLSPEEFLERWPG